VDTAVRDARFAIIKAYHDGPWVKPTLDLLRSETEWNQKMAAWQAEQRVVGAEAPPSIDWKHQAVVVLSLGSQFGQVGVTVNKCQVEGDLTILDLHFDVQDQWDPFGEPSHPAVLVAVDRADIKNVQIRCDAVVDGLPPGLSRKTFRPNGALAGVTAAVATLTSPNGQTSPIATETEVAAAPTSENVSLGETKTTWGRVKAGYRGVVSR
jgi:hypothetical protein